MENNFKTLYLNEDINGRRLDRTEIIKIYDKVIKLKMKIESMHVGGMEASAYVLTQNGDWSPICNMDEVKKEIKLSEFYKSDEEFRESIDNQRKRLIEFAATIYEPEAINLQD